MGVEVAPTRIAVRVTPGARTPGLTGRRGDVWTARVAAPPERGRANAELTQLLAGILGVGRRAVRVVSGETAPDKVAEVSGLDAAAAIARLEALVGATLRSESCRATERP